MKDAKVNPNYPTPIQRFIDKWEHFTTKNGVLYIDNYEIVPRSGIKYLLETLYKDNLIGMGKGIESLYNTITDMGYLGVAKKDVSEYLKSMPEYQMQREITTHTISRPIIVQIREPNQRWAIDLVEVQRFAKNNDNHKYIFTCIDYFSRYAWAEPLKSKKPQDIVDALDTIVLRVGGYPKMIQMDNGGEFKGAFKKYLSDHDVKKIYTQAHTPQSNGLIERFNKSLRRLINAYTFL